MLASLAGGPTLATAAADRGATKLRAKALHGKPAALRILKAPATSCSGEDDPNAPVNVQERAMRCMVNYARVQAGLPRLDNPRRLDYAAYRKAGDILRCNEFSHEACGRDFLFWMRESGYLKRRCWWAGENIAWGTGSLGTARSIMSAWLRSPSHRENLLGREYREFGIALRIGDLSGATGAHVWVNQFGRHC